MGVCSCSPATTMDSQHESLMGFVQQSHFNPAIITVLMPALKHGISFVPIHPPAIPETQATNLRNTQPSRKMTRSWRSPMFREVTSTFP